MRAEYDVVKEVKLKDMILLVADFVAVVFDSSENVVLDHYMKAVMVHLRIELKGFPIFGRKEPESMFAN